MNVSSKPRGKDGTGPRTAEGSLREIYPFPVFLLASVVRAVVRTASGTLLLFSRSANSRSLIRGMNPSEIETGHFGLNSSELATVFFLVHSALDPILRLTSSLRFCDFANASTSPIVIRGLFRTAREIILLDS